ncbi:hypothetical protein CK203_010925 [Vitis vinifera]|uniref:BAH domain-containing protein n=1 Tax=Vitis vinifera TaxID=29760 RepID=A0A438JI73_VITVI|nr:hypothetical protein CK203_010925 [Vitis vinifera]
MHGREGEKRQQRRHMWPVPPHTAVASDSAAPYSFCKDGRTISVGDCALFKPPQDSPPFIGIIRRLTVGKEDNPNPKLGVNWLYRPADIKLGKGILLEAAPNEVFYSFHKDEIPAASLLHPCKVAFLRKGVELPPGISSFVCRRVYDIENKCLWWLTDKDYINERQEEVDQLLDKTRLEMHGVVQSGGRSPKPLNAPASTQPLKPGADSVQNSASSFSSQGKGKKRGCDQSSDPAKRERLSKTDDGDSGQFRPENMLKSEIAKITDKGGLVDLDGVDRLVQLMQPDSSEKKIDLASRIMLVDVIAVTERVECLVRFVQHRGLPVLDEWLQEAHKGKIGDGSSPKENDKSVEEFLLASLRALDKLPVNLHALQTCNVGKSVNHLRSHKNSEIQKKARSLVDTWKRRVEAEMNIDDAKSGSSRSVSWQTKAVSSEVSHAGNRKTGGSSEAGMKSSIVQPPASRTPSVKLSGGEAVGKFASASPGSTKSLTGSAGINSKDPNSKMLVGGGSSDVPLTPIKEEKSSSSSQSQNNSQSCSSDHAKAVGSSCREDARSSTAGSLSANKISSSSSRHRKSSNGVHGSGSQKETGLGKFGSLNRSSTSEKVSPAGAMHEKVSDVPPSDHLNSQRLIVRLPNTGRSPARSASGGSFEDSAITFSRSSPPHPEKHDHHDKKVKGKNDTLRVNMASNTNAELCQSKDGLAGSDEGTGSPAAVLCDELHRVSEDGERPKEVSKTTGSSSGITPKSGKSYEASFSSINALIESCAKISEASASASPGDDIGMNLLASVAAGEISKSDIVSPLSSPGRNSPVPEDSCSGDDAKLTQLDEDIGQTQNQPNDEAIVGAAAERGNSIDSSRLKNGLRHSSAPVATDFSGDNRACEEKIGECSAQLNSSNTELQQNTDSQWLISDGKTDEKTDEHTHDASVAMSSIHATKEGNPEAEGVNQFHEQRRSGAHQARSNCISDSKLNVRSPLLDEDKKADCVDERTAENSMAAVTEATSKSVKFKKESNEEIPCLSERAGEDMDFVDKDSVSVILSEQKPPLLGKVCSESIAGKSEDAVLSSASGNVLGVESKTEKADNLKTECHVEQSGKQRTDMSSFVSEQNGECAEEKSERKQVVGHRSGGSLPHEESPATAIHEPERGVESSECKKEGVEVDGTKERQTSTVNTSFSAAGSDMAVKLDFDLNEGFPSDDGSQGELVKSSAPGYSSAVHVPCPVPVPISAVSGSFPASITVTAAAKGSFVPPENLLRTKDNPASKQGRHPLDIDLNVPDQRVYEDAASVIAAPVPRDGSAGGLDLDLNRVDESPDIGLFSVSNGCRSDAPPLPNRSSLSGGFSNGEVNASRDFDLNNGPSLDEVGTETAPRTQHAKNSVPFLSSVPGIRMNSTELGNFSSWFPQGSSYSAITIPSMLPGRGEQSYPIIPSGASAAAAAVGSQRIIGPTGGTPFGPEIYRGPVLSSSPAVPFPPAPPFQYPGFPFETNFPLSSNSFSGCSTAYVDSTSGGSLCFPAIPSQLVGPAGVAPPLYPRPYVMSLPGSASNVGAENRKWGSQGLDLNAGPGGTDTERRDERLPPALRQLPVAGSQALAEEQLKMYHQVAGGVLKRKEPDGGWDAADRFGYKQPSWQ